MFTWNGEPMRRRAVEQTRIPWAWAWIDWLAAWPVTTDCCPLEWVEDGEA